MSYLTLKLLQQDQNTDSSSSTSSSSYSVPYMIYRYKEELSKPDERDYLSFMRLSKVKILLTDKMNTNAIGNTSQYGAKEMMNIMEQIKFQKRLEAKMKKIRKLEEMGVKDIDPNNINDDI